MRTPQETIKELQEVIKKESKKFFYETIDGWSKEQMEGFAKRIAILGAQAMVGEKRDVSLLETPLIICSGDTGDELKKSIGFNERVAEEEQLVKLIEDIGDKSE